MFVRPESNSRPTAWQTVAQPTEPPARGLIGVRNSCVGKRQVAVKQTHFIAGSRHLVFVIRNAKKKAKGMKEQRQDTPANRSRFKSCFRAATVMYWKSINFH